MCNFSVIFNLCSGQKISYIGLQYSKQAVSSRSATHLAAEGMRRNDCPIYHSADK